MMSIDDKQNGFYMSTRIRVGSIGESISHVTSEQSAVSMGSGSLNVFATPAMIALMEAASVAAVDPYLDEDKTSVGIEVQVRHLSATPIGEQITAIAEITRLDGKRVTLEVRAWDEHEMIGEGTHVRYIIDADDFMRRVNRTDT